MTALNLTSTIAHQGHPKVSAISFGMTLAEYQATQEVLQMPPRLWTAKLERDYSGENSIVILSDAVDCNLAFLLDRQEGQVRLCRVGDEGFMCLGLFACVARALLSIDGDLRQPT